MNDIDRLEHIDWQFRRAKELKETEPEIASMMYAIASTWLSSLVECPHNASERPTINFKE